MGLDSPVRDAEVDDGTRTAAAFDVRLDAVGHNRRACDQVA